MGKKQRLNRLIRKWIKSDLPDDRSTVLLLGVTRIPTTPTAVRRPCSLPLAPSLNPRSQPNSNTQHRSRKHSSSRGGYKNCSAPGSSHIKCSKSNKRVVFDNSSEFDGPHSGDKYCESSESEDVTPTNVNSSDFTPPGPIMDRSVDSIGACSLDVDASVDLTDWSEHSSSGTLRSISLPTPEPQPHLPSYLSLACTVSGYSTTTNYDPERLAKSRDASPHRLQDELNSTTPQPRHTPLYTLRNNLLSPPNIVPLPHQKFTSIDNSKSNSLAMEEQLVSRQEFYSSSTRTTSFMSKESRSFVTNMFGNDVVDGCIENGFPSVTQSKCVNFESKSNTYLTNGSSKSISETSYKEFTNGLKEKSFIQQRVERLYGPGALAQGFFIIKRQKSRLSESEEEKRGNKSIDEHSKSMTENLRNKTESECNLKQSTSNPTLPVLRHLRPEFRAQLPIVNSKKCLNENIVVLPKSCTIPILKMEAENIVNGGLNHTSKQDELCLNGNQNVITTDDNINTEDVSKDGHYFLKILDKEVVRLLRLAERVENDLESNVLSEEVTGKLRSAAGKARLLSSQKMQQFKGLCRNNITQSKGEAFPTTNADLAGFWDMVLLQVEQIDKTFRDIEELKKNNWQEKKPVEEPREMNGNANKPRKINRPRPTTAANEELRKQREIERKKMIEERRKAMKEQKQNEKIEIFVPDLS